MNVWIMPIGIFLLLVIAIWFLLRANKKRKARKKLAQQIPDNLIKELEEIERRWATELYNGNNNPYTVAWERVKERRFTGEGQPNSGTSNTISPTRMDKPVEERRELQSGINLGNQQSVKGIEGTKGSSNQRNFFSRFKRK